MPPAGRTGIRHRLETAVLGVRIVFESNSLEALGSVRAAYGEMLPEDPAMRARRVRIVVDDTMAGGPTTPEIRLPFPDQLILQLPLGRAEADAARGEAIAQVSTAALSSASFRESVLDHLALFLVTRADRCPLHAAAIVRDGRALLVAGPSGAGKSSLTYAALREGFRILADDAVYVQTSSKLRLWGTPRGVHLPGSATRHFPELAGVPPALRPDGRSKISVEIPEPARAASPWEGAVGLCFLSASTDDRPMERLSPEDAVVEMRETIQGGFRRFAAEMDDCVRRIAQGGCWRVPVTAEPIELLRRIREATWADVADPTGRTER
jgi:hypothetical protein